ncbi:MAG: hypothetical protein JO250_09860, partial [Armatimonadetes bacterium]|nr:hypothetical protein [Armatimonadota bacterium]
MTLCRWTRYNRDMETLVCAATLMELRAFCAPPDEAALCNGHVQHSTNGFLLTGVGIPCALATVLEAAREARPARILNIGIAGAYPGSGLGLGDIVMGESEVYGDVGFELPEPPHFQPARGAAF